MEVSVIRDNDMILRQGLAGALFMVVFLFCGLALAQVDLVREFDFSRCGYAGSDRAVPFVKAAFVLESVDGDATDLVQQAIDEVSALPVGADGFRGAVLLGDSEFKVYGKLVISTSGVVLRGSEGSVLVAAGIDRRNLIEISGMDDAQLSKRRNIIADRVKAGTERLTLDNVDGLKPGDSIFIVRPSTKEWIAELGMDSFAGLFEWRLNWSPRSRDVTWDREITKIEEHTVHFDGPITTELDSRFALSYVSAYDWPGRIENVGVENLMCVSEYSSSNPKDEEHSWICVHVSNVKNAWVRNVTATHFAASAVMLLPSAMHVTVDNCQFVEPVSEIGGLRRVSFYNGGQLNLIKNCPASSGRHDFVAGHCSAGPNVFLDCLAEDALNFSGSHESWACGTLFDNVTINGNDIRLSNIKTYSQGAGFSASNCVVWNCNASEIDVSDPPGSVNYIRGAVGRLVGNTKPVQPYKFYPTRSLFETQLENRLGTGKFKELTAKAEYKSESPAEFVFDRSKVKDKPEVKKQKIEIINGRFVCNGRVFWSGHEGTEVWRGSLSPNQISAQPAPTRFAPGREGPHLTNDLEQVADTLIKQERRLLAQRPGLWYDRRRADHQKVRRKDGNVWGPLLEMPWARSGMGTAWDGLSKFDLTKFNPWYFSRIKEFADLCDEKQLLMYNQIYDNHNFIENGSHWVDFPWRPVNTIQNTGFSEPPPFTRGRESNHHYFIALCNEFYDVSDPDRRKLHALYIRKYLDTVKGNQNVLHAMGFQYSGSLEFAEFFFDTVIDWQNENSVQLMWSILTGKNVTDALLAERKYRDVISVIDMRYWQYLEDGTLYAPDAGENTAFRMYRKRAFSDGRRPATTVRLLYKQVREYKVLYPEKALMAYVAGVGSAPILMAGGAYAITSYDGMNTSKGTDSFVKFVNENLSDQLWKMNIDDTTIADPENNWCLSDPGKTYLVYTLDGARIHMALPHGDYQYRWFCPRGDVLTEHKKIEVRGEIVFDSPGEKALLLVEKR